MSDTLSILLGTQFWATENKMSLFCTVLGKKNVPKKYHFGIFFWKSKLLSPMKFYLKNKLKCFCKMNQIFLGHFFWPSMVYSCGPRTIVFFSFSIVSPKLLLENIVPPSSPHPPKKKPLPTLLPLTLGRHVELRVGPLSACCSAVFLHTVFGR